jgi:hypothetical protein
MMAQPLIVECQAESAEATIKATCGGNSCQKKKTKTNSGKKSCGSKNKECDRTNGCNPFASCSQCQYIAISKFIYNSGLAALKKNLFPSENEQTASGFNANCWQPPELMIV